ncbi:MAG: hypothetical protein R3360_02055 [Alphaproteobacteria bacterium]|nr:hypothetical protein [Alphaproteobacteria bacterium]
MAEDRDRTLRAIRETLRYLLADAETVNAPWLALHIRIAIQEAEESIGKPDPRSASAEEPFDIL